MRTAQAQLKEAERLFYLPLDLPWAARRLARLIKARLFITVETELWPNFLRQAKKNGARLMMANGRVSPRSYKTYRHLRPFFRRVLADYDRLNMIGPEDAERIIAMGADPDRVSVAGNVKFDRIADDVHPELAGAMRAKLGLARDTRLLVAGSTRPGEEEQILRAYRILLTEHPDLRLIIAPRHIERAPAVAALAEEAGFKTVLRSEPTPPLFPAGEGNTTKTGELPVIILDTMGELFAVYGLASLAFCGGSLVPLGGQNPLEPAAWGKTVLFGPSMEDFREAGELLAEAGAGFTVRDAEELAAKAAGLLDDPEGTTARGEAGRRAILAHGGASERNVAAIRELLQNN
jgi:3-deoxy-D-manno-octulosonic-acid transferase